jgi:predicted lipid-binding transport protein (Tim44 family)
LSEDTTFLYEGPDSVALSGDDFEDFIDGFEDGIGTDIPWLHGWWGKLLGGTLGLFGGLLAIFIAILVIVLLLAIFTSPLWVIALIIWLLVRDSRKRAKTAGYTGATISNTQSAPAAAPAAPAAAADPAADPAAAVQGGSQAPAEEPQMPIAQPYPNENEAMWKSGIMYSCVGVGLILVFVSIGAEGLWGVGALVACIGIAKLVIAKTSNKKEY